MSSKTTADGSPNSFEPSERVPGISRMSKKPLYFLLVVGFFLAAVLVYSVNFAHDPEKQEEEQKRAAIVEEPRPLMRSEGSGLALKTPTGAVVKPVEPKEPTPREPLVIVTNEAPAETPEEVAMRQRRYQSYVAGLSSNIVVRRDDTKGVASSVANQSEGGPVMVGYDDSAQSSPPQGRGANPLEASEYNPAADQDKERFFDRNQVDTDWSLKHQRMKGQPFELKTGAVIPGVMITGINSDLPGNMIAQVAGNVYDSASGNHLLVPQGSKLYGVYDSRVIYGQERVLIAWNRIIFPDGSAISLGAMPGADQAGFGGLTDKVNNHYLRVFGSAFLMSIITGGTAYAMDTTNNSSNNSGYGSNSVSMSDEMISSLSAQFGQVTTTLLQKNLNIKPTLEIRPGYQFNIIVTKDVIFKAPYSPWRR